MIETDLTFVFSNTHFLHKLLKDHKITNYSFCCINNRKIGIKFHAADEDALVAVLSGFGNSELIKEKITIEKQKWNSKRL